MFLRSQMPWQIFVQVARLLCVTALTVNSVGCPDPDPFQLDNTAATSDSERTSVAATHPSSGPAPLFSLPTAASEASASHLAVPPRRLLDEPAVAAQPKPAAETHSAEKHSAESLASVQEKALEPGSRVERASSSVQPGAPVTRSSLASEDSGEEATATKEPTAAALLAELEQDTTLQKEAAVAAIFELRRQRGSILAGTILSEEPGLGSDRGTDRGTPSDRSEASFAETLRQLSGLPPQPVVFQPSSDALAAPHANDQRAVEPIPPSNMEPIADHSSLATALRSAAKQLRRAISEPERATSPSLPPPEPRQARYRALADLLEAEAAMLLLAQNQTASDGQQSEKQPSAFSPAR